MKKVVISDRFKLNLALILAAIAFVIALNSFASSAQPPSVMRGTRVAIPFSYAEEIYIDDPWVRHENGRFLVLSHTRSFTFIVGDTRYVAHHLALAHITTEGRSGNSLIIQDSNNTFWQIGRAAHTTLPH